MLAVLKLEAALAHVAILSSKRSCTGVLWEAWRRCDGAGGEGGFSATLDRRERKTSAAALICRCYPIAPGDEANSPPELDWRATGKTLSMYKGTYMAVLNMAAALAMPVSPFHRPRNFQNFLWRMETRHAAGWSITLSKTRLARGRLVGRSFADMLYHNILFGIFTSTYSSVECLLIPVARQKLTTSNQ